MERKWAATAGCVNALLTNRIYMSKENLLPLTFTFWYFKAYMPNFIKMTPAPLCRQFAGAEKLKYKFKLPSSTTHIYIMNKTTSEKDWDGAVLKVNDF